MDLNLDLDLLYPLKDKKDNSYKKESTTEKTKALVKAVEDSI